MLERVRLGKTELQVSKIAFGGIPIQRLSKDEAVEVVRGVIDMGVNFLDTAYAYGDSEEKIGEAIKNYDRSELIIASKSPAQDKAGFLEQLETTLSRLGTDYVDIYQHHGLHGRERIDAIMGPGGAHEGMREAMAAGKIRHPAFSAHSLESAIEVMKTEKFEVTQIPFNFVDDKAAEEVIPLASKLDMGFISMKPLGGGLLDDAGLCFRYLMQFPGIVPDPGIEKLEEMKEILEVVKTIGPLTDAEKSAIERIKVEMGSEWCHRCDYCQPCPQGIPISGVLIAKSLAKRMPFERAFGNIEKNMKKSEECIECRECVERCPYDLDIPELMKKKREEFAVYAETTTWP